jgi:hydroxypyruvate reductase
LDRVLQVGPLPKDAVRLIEHHFLLVTDPELPGAAHGRAIRGIATGGKAALGRDLLDRLPDLRIVSCLGAGTEGIDVGELDRRGITLATTARVVASDVADVAIGLVIALARDFRGADRFVRRGLWSGGKYPLGIALSGAKLGILGRGRIGGEVAARARALGMEVGYHSRNRVPQIAEPYFGDLRDLACWCRFLVVCCPGGDRTKHLVDASIVDALGPQGYLVNVARGSIVDERAVVHALAESRLAGVGLDVFEAEPTPLPELIARDDVVLLPHIGSATRETREAMARAMTDALIDELDAR